MNRGETVVREVQGGSMKVSVTLRNLGDIAFTIRNIQITALLQDPRDPTVLLPIATLVPDPTVGGLDAVNLGPLVPMRGPFVFANTQVYPALIEDLMKDPRGLTFKIANFDINDEFGRNFAYTSQGINDRTGAVVIDYGGADPDGDLEGEVTERVRVSTAAGRTLYDTNGDGTVDDGDRRVLFDRDGLQVGITVRDALEGAMKLVHYDEDQKPSTSLTTDQRKNSYSTRLLPVDTNGDGLTDKEARAIWRIREVSRDDSPLKKWVVLTPTGIDDSVDVFDRLVTTGEGLVFAFVQDLDDDGIPARTEYVYGCSDTMADTDGDGLTDRLEVFQGWAVDVEAQGSVKGFASCARADSDLDGLTDSREYALRTDPKNVDTDDDGVTDADEINGYVVEMRFAFDAAHSTCTPIPATATVQCRTDPLAADDDQDGGRDGDEVAYGTDPTVSDGDRFADDDEDGLVNFFETQIGWTVGYNQMGTTCAAIIECPEDLGNEGPLVTYSVRSDPKQADADRDGLGDKLESEIGTDPARADTDSDGRSDAAEVKVTWTSPITYTIEKLLDPLDADVDDDLLNDGTEVGTPWLVYVGTKQPVQVYSSALVADADFDSLQDSFEKYYGTHPQVFDSDEDDHGDKAEVTRGTDPLMPDQLVNFRYIAVTSYGGCDSGGGDFSGNWQFDPRGVHGQSGAAVATVYSMAGQHLSDGSPLSLPTTAQRNYVLRAGDTVRAQVVDVSEYDATFLDPDDLLTQHTPKDVSYEATNQTYVLTNQEPGYECRIETTLVVTVL